MPRKPKADKPDGEVLAPISAEILDQLVRDGPLTAEEIEIASRRFKKALIERALDGELMHHLGYAPGAAPRSRGTFEPQLIGKARATVHGLRRQGIALYARRLTVREGDVTCTRAWPLPSLRTHRMRPQRLGNRTERGLPQRPHASSTGSTHKKPDTPTCVNRRVNPRREPPS